jgi:hypothetical protein
MELLEMLTEEANKMEAERACEKELQEVIEPVEVERVYWTYLGKDKNGNAIVRVYKDKAEFEATMDKAEERRLAGLKTTPKVTLDEADKFDRLMETLMKEDVTKVIPGRQTGRNLVIDYNKVEGTTTRVKKDGTKKVTVTKCEKISITTKGAI